MKILKCVYSRYGKDAMLGTRKLFNLSLKLIRQNAHLALSLKYKKASLVPASLGVKPLVKTPGGKRTAEKASRSFLSDRITECHTKIKEIKRKIVVSTANLAETVQQKDMAIILHVLKENIDEEKTNIADRHAKKFNELKEKNITGKEPRCALRNCDNVINLSKHVLTEAQHELLSRGLNYAIGGKFNAPRFLAEMESTIYRIPEGERDRLRAKVAASIAGRRQSKCHTINPSLKVAVRELKENANITITKADKGSKVVVLDTETYNAKALEHLSDTTTYAQVKKDPTPGLQRKVNKTVNNLITNNKISEEKGKQLRSINPMLPHFYGLPKVHRAQVPLRPVISSRGSPVYPLSRFLSQFLKPLLADAEHVITNVQQFLDELKILELGDNLIMTSFDVKSLYTSIPKDLVRAALEFFLTPDMINLLNENANTALNKQDIVELVELCLEATCFSFGERIYKQEKGVAMGLPASSTLADLVMFFIEFEIQRRDQGGINFWRRYVDDVFCVLESEQVQSVLDMCNSINSNIQFTIEIENNQTLPFLDILLKRCHNKITTSVYRKPISGNLYIHFSSQSPFTHKLSIIDALTYRMLRYCQTSQSRKEERKKIITDMSHNGFPPNLTKNRIKTITKRFYSNNSLIKTTDKFLTIPYSAGISENIARIFREEGYRTAYRVNHRLSTRLRPRGNVPEEEKRNVVYEIPCDGCGFSYIGQSGRSFGVRKGEHRASLGRAKASSKFAEHMSNPGHAPKWSEAKVIFSGVRPLAARLFLESFSSRFLFPDHYNESAAFPAQYDVIIHSPEVNNRTGKH